MNWPGMLLGFSAMLAVLAGAYAAFAREARRALVGAAVCAASAAAMCFALGSVFEAAALLLLFALAVPAAALAAVRLAPPASPDLRAGSARMGAAAAVAVGTFAALGWILTTAAWPPATGPRDLSSAWLGWRLLTDHIELMPLLGLAFVAAALVAASLIGPRARRRPRGEGGSRR